MLNRENIWKKKWLALTGMRLPDGGYPYYIDAKSAVEPTAHAVLAALAGGVPAEEMAGSIQWLIERQNADGSVSCAIEYPDQGIWLTAIYALVMLKSGNQAQASAAIGFLIDFRSITLNFKGVNDLDGSLVGWPWAKGCFSWVEPTAWSLLALSASGKGNDPRAIEGRRLLLDRQISGGGWNYGNKNVYGHDLLPFSDTTALAILALHGNVPLDSIGLAIKYIERDFLTQESPYALALMCLALRACKSACTDTALNRLETVMDVIQGERFNSVHYSLALQALGTRGVVGE